MVYFSDSLLALLNSENALKCSRYVNLWIVGLQPGKMYQLAQTLCVKICQGLPSISVAHEHSVVSRKGLAWLAWFGNRVSRQSVSYRR